MDRNCTCGAVEDGKWAYYHTPDCPAAWTLKDTIAKMRLLVDRAITGQHVDLSQHECKMVLNSLDDAFERGRADALADLADNARQHVKDSRT
jgi:hypothetical protein